MGPWAHGPVGPWAHGPVSPWARGPMGPWAPQNTKNKKEEIINKDAHGNSEKMRVNVLSVAPFS